MKKNSVMAGAEIRKWRESFGWSQAELGRRAETNQQTVDRIERGLTKHSRAASAITEAINGHLDSLDDRIKKSEKIRKSHYKLKLSPIPTPENQFPVFLFGGPRTFGLGYFSQIPTAFVDDPGEFAIQVEADDLPPPIQKGDYLFFSSSVSIEVGKIVLAFQGKQDDPWEYMLGVVIKVAEDRVTLVISRSGAEAALSHQDFHIVGAISRFNLKAPLATSAL
jgi:transcriptional regulator with XRE-family HTH domain